MTRTPPHNADAEASVLGAVLLRNDALGLVSLTAEQFYDPRHREVFGAMRSLQARSRPIDPVTLEAELRRTERTDAVGGLSFLSDLMAAVPTADNVQHYADLVADAALKRRVIVAASEVAARGFRADVTGGELHAEMLRQASAVESADQGDKSVPLGQLAAEAAERIIAAAEGRAGVVRSLRTGYEDLDGFGGLARGVVTIVAGRPSQGKSALARKVALNVAQQGIGAHVFSLEDARDQYGNRTLSDLADVDLAMFSEHRPTFTRDEAIRLRWAAAQVKDLPLSVDDTAGLSSQQIATRVRMRKRALGTQLVVVDYVQLMRERGVRGERRHEVDAAMQGLVTLAREEDVAVLLLSQLSRESERRDDKRPMLSDLRESGGLEQDAYAVWIVHQEWRYLNPESKNAEVRAAYERARGLGEVLVRKNKNGRTGDVRLKWDATAATYREPRLADRYGR